MPRTEHRTAVAEGSTDSFDLAEVLQLASASRLFTVVEVHSQHNHYLGSVYLKGGQVLESVTTLGGGDVGLVGISRLLRHPGPVLYRIFRADSPNPLPQPLGRIESLLLELDNAEIDQPSAKPEPSGPPVMAVPPALPAPVPSVDLAGTLGAVAGSLASIDGHLLRLATSAPSRAAGTTHFVTFVLGGLAGATAMVLML